MTSTKLLTRDAVLVSIILGLTIACYWPGLAGGYIFDDFSFIVDNTAVHVTSMEIAAWVRAALSFPAGHQGRWLTMLSFAANHYLTGLDPFWMKATNLCIHLLNGALLIFVLSALLDFWYLERKPQRPPLDPTLAAIAITGCWLVLPINLTAVLYAAQRLESLCNIFVFGGLWWYLRARIRLARTGIGVGSMAGALVTCTVLGLLAKESAILLPLYAACVELAIPGLRDADGRWRLPVVRMYACLLAVPMVIGALWLASWIGGKATYVRDFSTFERLLTEARVLVNYIGWSLTPLPRALSLYHDDIRISRGLLDPPATILSIAVLLALLAFALRQRSKRPLFALGIFWFFSAHMLTGTVIPLELVYEHRNYFASCGLLLSAASAISLEPFFRIGQGATATLFCAVLSFYALMTNLRAREWDHPVHLAISEADRHPKSPNAEYDLARVLILSSGYNPSSPAIAMARDALEKGMKNSRSHSMCEEGLIILAAHMRQPIDDAWWASMTAKFAAKPPTEGDVSGLASILECQTEGICPMQTERFAAAFKAAMSHPTPSPRLLSTYANFTALQLHDNAVAESLMRRAVAAKPRDAAYRVALIQFLLETGAKQQARNEFELLRSLNYFGSLDETLRDLDARIDEK